MSPASAWYRHANERLVGDPENDAVDWRGWDELVQPLASRAPEERKRTDVAIIDKWLQRVASQGLSCTGIPHTIRLALHFGKLDQNVGIMVLASFSPGRPGVVRNSCKAILELVGADLSSHGRALQAILRAEVQKPAYVSRSTFISYFDRMSPVEEVYWMDRLGCLALLLAQCGQQARETVPLLKQGAEFAQLHRERFRASTTIDAINAALAALKPSI